MKNYDSHYKIQQTNISKFISMIIIIIFILWLARLLLTNFTRHHKNIKKNKYQTLLLGIARIVFAFDMFVRKGVHSLRDQHGDFYT